MLRPTVGWVMQHGRRTVTAELDIAGFSGDACPDSALDPIQSTEVLYADHPGRETTIPTSNTFHKASQRQMCGAGGGGGGVGLAGQFDAEDDEDLG
ncbi:hypothetical protein EV182_008658, partial [Spiromyces aspiralis]